MIYTNIPKKGGLIEPVSSAALAASHAYLFHNEKKILVPDGQARVCVIACLQLPVFRMILGVSESQFKVTKHGSHQATSPFAQSLSKEKDIWVYMLNIANNANEYAFFCYFPKI